MARRTILLTALEPETTAARLATLLHDEERRITMGSAARAYDADVKARTFPGLEHTF